MYDGTIGEIRLFAGDFEPRSWAFCNGQTLQISGNEALFCILGTNYGGDGRRTFQLPKLAPITESDGGDHEINYIICLQGTFPSRN